MAAPMKIFRCRKCREDLFSSSCVTTVHGQPYFVNDNNTISPSSTSCQDVATETQWYIAEDLAPYWILEGIEKVQWTKGKLLCPKCGGRLGSFDFLTQGKCGCGQHVVPAIHVVRGRVDVVKPKNHHSTATIPKHLKMAAYTTQTMNFDKTATPNGRMLPVDLNDNDLFCPENGNDNSPTVTSFDSGYHSNTPGFERSRSSERCDLDSSANSVKQTTLVTNAQFHLPSDLDMEEKTTGECRRRIRRQRMEDSLRGDNGISDPTNQDVDFGRRYKGRRCRNGTASQNYYTESPGRYEVLMKLTPEDETTSGTQVQETKHSEDPDSDISDQSHEVLPVIPEDHSCPICLDLYCSPIQVSACGHVFCETCLHLLVKNKPVNTPCPLCRQVISGCHRDDRLTYTLKTQYPFSYKQRLVNDRRFRKGKYYPLPQFRKTTPLRLTTRERNNNNIWDFNFFSAISLFLQGIVGLVILLCFTLIRFHREMVQEVAEVRIPLLILCTAVGALLLFLFVISVLYFVSHVYSLIIGFISLLIAIFTPVAHIFGQITPVIVENVFYPELHPFNPYDDMPPSNIPLQKVTANFFAVVIIILACRCLFFRRVMTHVRQNA